jgi:hypothetical protein
MTIALQRQKTFERISAITPLFNRAFRMSVHEIDTWSSPAGRPGCSTPSLCLNNAILWPCWGAPEGAKVACYIYHSIPGRLVWFISDNMVSAQKVFEIIIIC